MYVCVCVFSGAEISFRPEEERVNVLFHKAFGIQYVFNKDSCYSSWIAQEIKALQDSFTLSMTGSKNL